MSELNRVIENRLAATEANATAAAAAAAAAQSSSDGLSITVAGMAGDISALHTSASVHYEGSEPGSPKDGDTWFDSGVLKMRCGGDWFTITGS